MTLKLLREYIQAVLVEDMGGDYGGLGFGDAMGDMPYGMHFASQDQLYKIFVKPFADVVGVAAGKTKELSQRGITALNVAFEAIATTLIPILKDSYGEIFQKEKQQIDKIRSEYSDVYQATWDAFNEMDVVVAAFAYRPDLFLTAKFAKHAPKAAAKLLSVLSGGSLDNVLHGLLKSSGKRHVDHSEGPGMPIESLIREEKDNEPSKLEKLITNKKIKQVLAGSPKVQQLAKVGSELVQGTLKDVFSQANNVMNAKSLQDLQSKLGKKLPGIDKLSQVPQREREQAEQKLLVGVQRGMKEFYVKQLEGQVKAAIEAGVPKDHPFVADYVSVISKIKGL